MNLHLHDLWYQLGVFVNWHISVCLTCLSLPLTPDMFQFTPDVFTTDIFWFAPDMIQFALDMFQFTPDMFQFAPDGFWCAPDRFWFGPDYQTIIFILSEDCNVHFVRRLPQLTFHHTTAFNLSTDYQLVLKLMVLFTVRKSISWTNNWWYFLQSQSTISYQFY